EAKLRAECCPANKAKLCRAYLEKCENFKKSFPKDIVEEILALPVPEDKINSSEDYDDENTFAPRPMDFDRTDIPKNILIGSYIG
ncbi:16922_t:CDS:2, partial [Racocetra fulgida]